MLETAEARGMADNFRLNYVWLHRRVI